MTWSDLAFNDPISGDQVRNQVIWYNSNIRVQGKPVCYTNWLQKGVVKIADLLDKSNTFLSHKAFCNKYEYEVAYTEYYSILTNIPGEWKIWIMETTGPKCSNMHENVCATKKTVAYCYNLKFQDLDVLLPYSYESDDLVKLVSSGRKIMNFPEL